MSTDISIGKLYPPLRWPGGKSRLAEEIVSRITGHTTYVETRCGSAGVFWAKPKDISKAEVLNDLDGELVNFYEMLHRRGKLLAWSVSCIPYGRLPFNRMLAEKPRTAFRRAVRFWYLNRVAFGARRRKPTYGVAASKRMYVLPARILYSLDATIERLRGVTFECLDVCRLIRLYDRPETFFYVDPPYVDVSQEYACQFGHEDHVRLAKSLRSSGGRWLLSYNDCDLVRRLYRGFQRTRLAHRYTMGCNTLRGASSNAAEVLIQNFATDK